MKWEEFTIFDLLKQSLENQRSLTSDSPTTTIQFERTAQNKDGGKSSSNNHHSSYHSYAPTVDDHYQQQALLPRNNSSGSSNSDNGTCLQCQVDDCVSTAGGCINSCVTRCCHPPLSPQHETVSLEEETPPLMLKLDITDFCESYYCYTLMTNPHLIDNIPNKGSKVDCEHIPSNIRNTDAAEQCEYLIDPTSNFDISSPIKTCLPNHQQNSEVETTTYSCSSNYNFPSTSCIPSDNSSPKSAKTSRIRKSLVSPCKKIPIKNVASTIAPSTSTSQPVKGGAGGRRTVTKQQSAMQFYFPLWTFHTSYKNK